MNGPMYIKLSNGRYWSHVRHVLLVTAGNRKDRVGCHTVTRYSNKVAWKWLTLLKI